MAAVRKVYPSNKTNFMGMINSISCPFATITESEGWMYINLANNATVNLNVGSRTDGVYVSFTYKNDTPTDSLLRYYSAMWVVLCYSENVFYLQINDRFGSASNPTGRSSFIVYEKIETVDYVGWVYTTDTTRVGFRPITDVSLMCVSDELLYKHTNVFTYDAGVNRIDYSPHDILTQGGVLAVDDPNFVACTSVNGDQVCTFNGHNYYAVGTHTLLLMDD